MHFCFDVSLHVSLNNVNIMTHLSVKVETRPDSKGLPTFTCVQTATVVFLSVHCEAVPTRVGLATILAAIGLLTSVT